MKMKAAKAPNHDPDDDEYEVSDVLAPKRYVRGALYDKAKAWLQSFEDVKSGQPAYVVKLQQIGRTNLDADPDSESGRANLLIDGHDLAKSPEGQLLVQQLKIDPRRTIEAFERAAVDIATELNGETRDEDPEIPQIKCRFRRMDALRVSLAKAGGRYYHKMISLRGRAASISRRKAYCRRIVYECKSCTYSAVLEVQNMNDEIRQPTRCSDCHSKKIEIIEADVADSQVIKLVDARPSGLPNDLYLWCLGEDLCNKVRPGRLIEVTGILDVDEPESRFAQPTYRLNVNWLEYHDTESEDFELTDADMLRFSKKNPDSIVNQPGFWEKSWLSYAPEVLGMREIKEALLLLSCSLRLFLSVDEERQSLLTLQQSTTINVLVAGSPSSAKSRLLKYTARVAPNSGYITAARATDASLSIFAGKDEYGMFMVELGLITRCNNGIVCIDELDKAKDKSVYDTMHEPMSDKIVTSLKGGQHVTMPADVAVVCACNSAFPEWNTRRNLQENLSFLPPSLLSRFDVIFIVIDKPSREGDLAIAAKLFEINDPEWWAKYMEDKDDVFGFRTMKKYITYVNTYVPIPVFPESLKKAAEEHYAEKRQVEELQGLIFPRYLNNVMHLSTMHARFLQKPEVEEEDVDLAVRLLDFSMKAAAADPVTGRLDGNIIYGEVPKSTAEKKRKEKDVIMAVFEKLSKELGNREGFVPDDVLFAEMAKAENGSMSKTRLGELLRRMDKTYLFHSYDNGREGRKPL